MQLVMTAIAVTGGMVFSLAIAILVEELIFGKVFRLFFVRTEQYGGRASSPVSARSDGALGSWQ